MTKTSKELDRDIKMATRAWRIAAVTAKQIRALKTEAAEHGDDMQWLLCERALGAGFDTDDYTGGGHRISPAQWGLLRKMSQDEARDICAAAIVDGQG